MSGKKQAGATPYLGAAFKARVPAAEARTFRRDLALLAPQPLPDHGSGTVQARPPGARIGLPPKPEGKQKRRKKRGKYRP
jgi:hypothetical protein